jgi:hypothetical protein
MKPGKRFGLSGSRRATCGVVGRQGRRCMRSGVLLAKNILPFVVWCRVTGGIAPAVRRRSLLAGWLVERLWKDRPRDCSATGDEQEHGGRRRFLAQGVSGLYEELRRGPRPISDERVAQLVRKMLKSKPKAATHWSTRQITDEPEYRNRLCTAFGKRLACSRIGKNISSSRAIHFL